MSVPRRTDAVGHNLFIAEYFDWPPRRTALFYRVINRILQARKITYRVGPHSGAMSNIEKRMNIYHLLSQVLAYKVPGDIVELGCYEGEVACLLETVIQCFDADRDLHLYDSFSGLPPTSREDAGTTFSEGSLRAEPETVVSNFMRLGLRQPLIHKGWFADTLSRELPPSIAFAHLDGDFYDSIMDSLVAVYPRLSPGSICVVDDYCDPSVSKERSWRLLPGVKAACDEFFKNKAEQVYPLYAGEFAQGYFRKS